MWRAFRANDVPTDERLLESLTLQIATKVDLEKAAIGTHGLMCLATAEAGVTAVQYLCACLGICQALKPDTLVDVDRLRAAHPKDEIETNSMRTYTYWVMELYLSLALNEIRSTLKESVPRMIQCCDASGKASSSAHESSSSSAASAYERMAQTLVINDTEWVHDVVRLCLLFVQMPHPPNPDELTPDMLKRLKLRAQLAAVMRDISALGTEADGCSGENATLKRFEAAHDLHEWCAEIKKSMSGLSIDKSSHLLQHTDLEWRRLVASAERVSDLQQHYFLYHRLMKYKNQDCENAAYCLQRLHSLSADASNVSFASLANELQQHSFEPAVAISVPAEDQKERSLPAHIPPPRIQIWFAELRKNTRQPVRWIGNSDSMRDSIPRFDLRPIKPIAVVGAQ